MHEKEKLDILYRSCVFGCYQLQVLVHTEKIAT